MENDINLPINPIIENDDNNASEDFVLGAPVSKSKGNGTKKSTGTQNKSTQNKSTQNKSTQNKSTQNKSTKNKSTQNKSDKNKGNGSTAKKTKEEVKEDVQKAEQENPTQAPDLYNIYWDNMLLDLYDNNYNSEAEKDLLENLDVQQLSTENTIGQQLNSININHIEKELNFDPLENLLINGQSGQKNGLWGNDFSIRDWGIKDYLNERGAFQKGLGSMLGEPTWFYFKIFFKFNTNFGLFGNIMRGDVPRRDNTSAERYLSNIRTRYYQEQPANRRNALIKFVRTLSYINCKAPWMFFSVKDLHNALVYDLSKAGAPKAITLEFMQEAIDMRLTTLFDLYRYAAYDFAHDKEVIPENLRKFEMDIVLFQVPIKRLQTAMKTLTNRKAFYKSFSPNINYGETLSYQLFSFQNCEFDINSFSSLIPSSINNDKPFGLKPSIKINYDRCYHHTFNEFTQFLIGDSRYLYIGYGEDQLNLANNDDKKGSSPPPESQLAKLRGDNSFVEGSQQNRIKMLQYGMDNANIHNETSNNYAALIEASEDIIGESLRMISPKIALGNIYQQNGWNDIWKNYGDLAANTWDKFAKQWKFSKTDFEDYLGITRKDHQKTIDETVKPPTKDSESIKRPNPYNPDDIRKQWEEDAKNWKQTEENKIKNLYRLMHHSDYGEDCTPKYTPKGRKIENPESFFGELRDKFEKSGQESLNQSKKIFDPEELRKQWEEDAKNWKQTEENRVKDLYRLMHHSDYGDICQPKYSPKSRKIDDAEKYFENIQNVFRKHSSYDAEKHRQEDDEKFEEIINILRKRYE